MFTSQQHLTSPETVGAQLEALLMWFHLMNDEDRDYLKCARIALDDKIEWKV